MTLEDRIKQLENRCRLLSIAMTCSLVGGGVFVLAAASQQNKLPDSLQAKKLEIVDESGTVRIRLGQRKEGGYGLSVYDKEGDAKQAGVSLGVSTVRAELQLCDGESSVEAVTSPIQSTVILRDSDGTHRVYLEASARRPSKILVLDKRKRPIFDSTDTRR